MVNANRLVTFGIVFLCANMLVFNFMILYALSAASRNVERASTMLAPVLQVINRPNCSKDVHKCIRDFLEKDEAGKPYLYALHQAYVSFVQEIVQRFVFVSPTGEMQNALFDVSTGEEFSFIWKRLQLTSQPKTPLVVDVGAMNGVTGSNSYNFLQLGWRGVLVEPQIDHFNHAELYDQRWVGLGGRVDFVHAALSEKDGTSEMCCFVGDNSKTSCTLEIGGSCSSVSKSNAVVSQRFPVPVLSAKSLIQKYNIPCGRGDEFGVLSIDAEGVSASVLKYFMSAGCRPRFVIFEVDDEDSDAAILKPLGYEKLVRTSASSKNVNVFRNNIWELYA